MVGGKPYAKLISRREREALERVLDMESGYLLDFSDRTFNDFFYASIDIDPERETHLFDRYGTSKAKRFRSFVERAQPALVAKILRKLWEHIQEHEYPRQIADADKDKYFSIIGMFEGDTTSIDTSAFDAFEPSETLEELVASIKRDLDVQRPHAGLDRLHTYCMKRYAALVEKSGGGTCGKNDPLHSRVGRYVKLLTERGRLTPMSERIIRSSISVFEQFNPIRNDRSLAHDNEALVSAEEARFIFDSVTAFLRFTKAIDGRHFGE